MKLLIIDTSRKEGVCALYRKGAGIEKKEFDSQNQQKFLIPVIDELLQTSNLILADLDGIAICIGPGSFTGTRIGVMTAKTFAYTTNIPLIPFNSLLPFHTPGTLTLLNAKNETCFLFDGASLEKVAYTSLANDPRPLYSPYPDTIPLPTNQAFYSFENILKQSPQIEINLIY